MGLAQLGVCKPLASSNPMFGVKRLSLNRKLNRGCRVDAQHQIGFNSNLLVLRPGSVGIDAALNLGDALFVAMNHTDNRDHAADYNRADGDQQSSQARNGIDHSHLFFRAFTPASSTPTIS